jgi:plasmid stabilization system protein ParE
LVEFVTVALGDRRPQAALDIMDICDHIAEDKLDAADRWVDDIGTTFERLATPELVDELRSHP